MTQQDYILWGVIAFMAVAGFIIGFIAGLEHQKKKDDNSEHE